MVDLEALEKLHKATSEGKWNACREGKCSCSAIWCPDYPVADVTRGAWGDTYPALIVEHDKGICGSVLTKAEIKMIEYGEVKDEQATANAQAIVALHNAFPEILERLRSAEEALRKVAATPCGVPGHSVAVSCGARGEANVHLQKLVKGEDKQ